MSLDQALRSPQFIILMATNFFCTAMAGGLGTATGPLTGGLIYDAFASYGWLFIGSFGLGIGAFLIALTFKPFNEVSRATATGTLFHADQR
jgi:MFS family permease